MNEAEIVDVALGILIESRKKEKACEQPALVGADNPELCPPCSVSPHTSSGSSSEEEDSGKEALAAGLSPSQRPGDSNSACRRSPEEEEEEEEDVLKYVREIFFS
ncbi:cell cycle regulator of non-homologous end joining isoform X4 [Theropithecus gelada]|nr:cell cycle regulator of non-homologous end joining isoform X4 [Theropithecus gelada]XP_025234652.1 cell cycle regulator of non-homologous end joining isoform X4 [Theropithecus gelada]XP_025234653.1 cell cycle regulator of non-homologous end joining isoform X4 [Theropithecus gelada]XP_025234654.1 cell cycle regulator of non-homologous end joining isoform X4 [Theropithecus gelada]XP_025234655.1 cell cycle regulator of non-homologous end joining isoform X4 [Theropithecus gelada]XP_025234656.1 